MDYQFMSTALLVIFLTRGGECSLTLMPNSAEYERQVNQSLIVTCRESLRTTDMIWKSPSGDEVPKKGRVHVEKNEKGLALIFEKIERTDKGNYTCNALVDGQKERIAFTLSVQKPISFSSTPDRQNATEYSNYLVQCTVEGDPAPNVVWLVRNQPPEGPRFRPMANGLYINNVTLNDSGVYQCRAVQMTAFSADLQTKEIHLKVQHKPKWKNTSESTQNLAYGYLSGVVNLTCEVIADPEPQFVWRRHNHIINPDHHNATLINEPQRSILQLPVHNESTFGEYKCEASNKLGRLERIIMLQKGVKPKPPKQPLVMSVARHTAVVQIPQQPAEDAIIGYRIQFVLKQPGIQHTWDAPDYQDFMKENGGPNKYTVINLLENTPYALRVSSRNAAGLSDFTEEVSFRTSSSDTGSAPSVRASLNLLCTLLFISLIVGECR
ncbi:neural cell adhesion molecule 2 isoform X2 [Nilaparvata lugens]|uniref:neural cell adhesion molecule 2 isoform X2 n=1 Tax=Nilaparvata lugens TaxID=108931 RepID=UPI000B982C1A|nr:neural cell adhesion molecule 2 isoform X2 [Nilaparvata lugens]